MTRSEHPTTDLVLAVDCGGTKVEAALVDSDGRVVPATRFRRPTGQQASAEQLADRVSEVVAETLGAVPTGSEVIGIGIGTAGPIDMELGLVSPVNIHAWRRFPLRQTVTDAAALAGIAVPVTLRLDGSSIALAEHWVGAGAGSLAVLGMVISTGIGGGIVLDGRLVTGASGNAGHLGQIEVAGFTGPGEPSTLEDVASGPNTVAWAVAQGWVGSSGEELAASWATGDPIALAAVERCGSAVGRALASVSTLLDLDVIVIGGGFSRVTPALFDIIRSSLIENAPLDYAARVRVVPSGLDTDGPLIGAAALAWRAGTV